MAGKIAQHGRNQNRHNAALQAQRNYRLDWNYKKRLGQAEADLAAINATITIFEASGDPKGAAVALCKRALIDGPLDTRQIALAVIKAKGLNTGDKVLAKSVMWKLIHALRLKRANRSPYPRT